MFADGFAFVDGETGGLVDDQERIVFENDVEFLRRLFYIRCCRLERDIELDFIPAADDIAGLGALAVEPYAMLAKKFSDVTDGKLFF